jgi:hypothetical protein
MNISSPTNDRAVIEARLAARLAGGLTLRAATLPHDVTERLRFAREQALSRAREVRQAAPAPGGAVVGVSARGAATLGGFVPWWQRAASVLPLVVLVAGLVMIDRWSVREQVLAAADFDSQLLSDSLPPAAYSDPGFAEFLRSDAKP